MIEFSLATPEDADDFIRTIGDESEPASVFSPTRFPYTYACDYIRKCSGNLNMSRGDASQLRKRWAEENNVTDESLAILLALRYIQRYNITTNG